jgi:UDP-glucose 4-epimerase
MKRILIVGSKGFIGSQAVNYFTQAGYLVWGADVVSDYVSKNYFLIDATNSDFREIFSNTTFDVCLNCSGAASVPDSINHPLRDFSLNVTNVFKILDSIKTYQSKCKFINLSSAAVYGNPTALPVKESNVTKPVSPYGVHKLISEQICNEFFQLFGIATCSLRIFSAYGEGLKKQLFWDLYQRSKLNNPVTLFGSGNESRDFIYIEDLLQAIQLVLEKAEFQGQVINVANGDEVFIKDVVNDFYDLFEMKVEFQFSGETRAGDPLRWKANIDVLHALGYQRRFSLEEGLKNYLAWILKEEE